jgi:hypothetical protein
MTNALKVALIIIFTFFSFASLATAADGIGKLTPPPSGLATQDVETGSITLVNNFLAFLTAAAAVWFLVTIIWSGIKIIQSAKSPEDFYTHMKKIMWAAIGMILVATAYIIAAWITNTLFGSTSALDNPLGVFK